MATKCITITTRAYDLLAVRKGETDSFSDVIEHLATPSVLELAGLLSKKSGKKLKKHIRETRSEMEKEIDLHVERFV